MYLRKRIRIERSNFNHKTNEKEKYIIPEYEQLNTYKTLLN